MSVCLSVSSRLVFSCLTSEKQGLPIKHLGGQQLDYVLNGVYTWYLSVALVLGVHYLDWWSLTRVYDNFGRIMTCAIVTQVLSVCPSVSVCLYVCLYVCPSVCLSVICLTTGVP
jgi:hypothetical protein